MLEESIASVEGIIARVKSASEYKTGGLCECIVDDFSKEEKSIQFYGSSGFSGVNLDILPRSRPLHRQCHQSFVEHNPSRVT